MRQGNQLGFTSQPFVRSEGTSEVRSCNRHYDCDAADSYQVSHGNNGAFHCDEEGCLWCANVQD